MGASIARTVIGFDVFEAGTLQFKASQSDEIRLHNIWLFTVLGAWTGWSFFLSLIGAIGNVFLLASAAKKNGFIVMSMLMMGIMTPVQAYLSWQDFQLWRLFDPYTGMPLAQSAEIVSVFFARYSSVLVNVSTGLLILMGISLVVVLAVRPLTQPDSKIDS